MQAAREVIKEPGFSEGSSNVKFQDEPSAEEEELRRLFEAGRNIVEGKMEVVGSKSEQDHRSSIVS